MNLNAARLRSITLRIDTATAPVRFVSTDGRELALVGWEANGSLVFTLSIPDAEPGPAFDGTFCGRRKTIDYTAGDRVPNSGDG